MSRRIALSLWMLAAIEHHDPYGNRLWGIASAGQPAVERQR